MQVQALMLLSEHTHTHTPLTLFYCFQGEVFCRRLQRGPLGVTGNPCALRVR